MSVTMSWDWRSLGPIRVGEEGALTLPPVEPDPAVFRLRFVDADGDEQFLVGQGTSLSEEVEPYEKPDSSPRADVAVRDRIRSVVADGGQVELEIMEDIDVRGLGPVWLTDDLPRRMLARVVEMSVQDRLLGL